MSKNDKNPKNPFFDNCQFNQMPLCHQLPERTIYIRNKALPLCARCTGVLLGVFSLPFFHWGIIHPTFLNTILLGTPALIDATTQYWGWRESNNLFRIITGFLLGCGVASLIVIGGKILAGILIQY